MIPGGVNLILAGGGEYEIANSLRFRASNNAKLTRTPSSASNRRTYTWSAWIKRGNLSSNQHLFGVNAVSAFLYFRFNSSNILQLVLDAAVHAYGVEVATPVWRDPSAWYHIVLAVDTTQSTQANRIKIYVNSVQQTVTAHSGGFSFPPQNYDTFVNAVLSQDIGIFTYNGTAQYDGYMAEVNFIDGQALTPSSFGQTDSTTGVWNAKKYSGTYGTNGYYLKFADASAATAAAIGKDSSGNGNNWTPSGISVTSGTTFDQMTDTPTNNYAVWNPLDAYSGGTYATFANSRFGVGAGVGYVQARSTLPIPSSGKWYFEFTFESNGAAPTAHFGLASNLESLALNTVTSGEVRAVYTVDGTDYNGTTSTGYGAAIATGSIVGCAVDMDNGTVKFHDDGQYANGTGSWNQTYDTGASAFTDLVSSGKTWFLWTYIIQGYAHINAGQKAFAYTPPSGFKALNTANLPTPSIKKGSLFFDATTRTGTGASASVSSLGFQPDLVWIKGRSGATDHGLYDAVRGVQKQIESNQSGAETTETTGLTAFSSNGYTVGALAQLNTSAATYVDWAWKEGATPGFDIVTWTADGTSPRNISHSLEAVPKLIITKQRSPSADNWFTYHASLGATKNVRLDETAAAATQTGAWNNTAPTSSQFTTGNFVNFTTNGNALVAYLWSEIEGFSKISSYTGNGSTDGPFVFCGFRPRWLIIKPNVAGENWIIIDTARDTYNVNSVELYANLGNAEGSANRLDILSNGFKIRSTGALNTGTTNTYIFAAYAENPFKYARAR